MQGVYGRARQRVGSGRAVAGQPSWQAAAAGRQPPSLQPAPLPGTPTHRVSSRMAVSNAPAATCSAARLHLVCQRCTADTPGEGATKESDSPPAPAELATTSAATSAGISRSCVVWGGWVGGFRRRKHTRSGCRGDYMMDGRRAGEYRASEERGVGLSHLHVPSALAAHVLKALAADCRQVGREGGR